MLSRGEESPLLIKVLAMQTRIPLAFLAASVYCWLMFSIASTSVDSWGTLLINGVQLQFAPLITTHFCPYIQPVFDPPLPLLIQLSLRDTMSKPLFEGLSYEAQCQRPYWSPRKHGLIIKHRGCSLGKSLYTDSLNLYNNVPKNMLIDNTLFLTSTPIVVVRGFQVIGYTFW